MLEDQLYLLLTVFASRGDATNVKLLHAHFNKSNEYLCAICMLWPELSNPNDLKFLFDDINFSNEIDSNNEEDNELLVKLLESDSKLVSLVEMDRTTTSARCDIAKDFINKKNAQLELDDNSKFTNLRSIWLRKRILYCDDFNPHDVLFNKPLWENLLVEDLEFQKWIKGIVEPLSYIQNRLEGNILKIKDFEAFTPSDVVHLILDDIFSNTSVLDFDQSILERELLPYLDYTQSYGSFIENFFTYERFPLNSKKNYILFKQVLVILIDILPEGFSNKLQEVALKLIYENSKTIIEITSSDELQELIFIIHQDIEIKPEGINATVLRNFAHYMNVCLQDYSLKDVHAIRYKNESEQLADFASAIKMMLTRSNGRYLTMSALQTISNLISNSENESAKIFTNVAISKQVSVLIEILLELGEFDLLQDFITSHGSTVEEDILEKYFWHFFNNATNGLRTRPEMIKAEKILHLLLVQNKENFQNLQILLDVTDIISHYSINLGKGIPFKPSNIFDFKSNPSKIITMLLEFNKGLYRDIDQTYDILRKLYEGMKLDTKKDQKDEYNQILVAHIDYSLANMDFSFAFQKSKELLQKDNISTYWITVFQVGKFINPTWPDNEIPTEVIFLQLEILGDLMHICPKSETEAIISQWSSLELELATRELTNDKYTVKNIENGDDFSQVTNLLNGVSSGVTSFLSSTLN